MKLCRYEVVESLAKSILEDEFDDEFQNEDVYEGDVSGWDILRDIFRRRVVGDVRVLDVGCGSGELFGKLLVTHAVEPNKKRFERAKEKGKRYGVNVKRGVAEAIPFRNSLFDLVLMWGTWCFLRSWDETMVEVNRVLKKGGLFVFDYYIKSSLPIAKVNEEGGLIQRFRLFGFEIVERGDVLQGKEGHRKYLVVEKVREFDWRWLRLPQVVGTVNNYLEERDWWMG